MESGSGEGLFALIFFLFFLWFVVWFAILLPARMARKRGRSAVGWVLFGFITSPPAAICLLWLLGPSWKVR